MWAGPGPWSREGVWLWPLSLSANHSSSPSSSSATGGHWSFLRTIFSHCPPGELPECLRVVSHKLLSNSVALPQWLVELFQVSPWHWGSSHGTWGHMVLGATCKPIPPQATDAVALLKVLLSFDLLQLATEVALHSMDQSRHSVSAPLLQWQWGLCLHLPSPTLSTPSWT